MAEIATIARPYAEALFKSVQSDLVGTFTWLEAVAAVASDVQLQQFASNPNAKSDQVFELLTSVYIGIFILLFSSYFILIFEKEFPDNGTDFHSYADAVYWSIITMTTIGYGENFYFFPP